MRQLFVRMRSLKGLILDHVEYKSHVSHKSHLFQNQAAPLHRWNLLNRNNSRQLCVLAPLREIPEFPGSNPLL